MSVEYDWNVRAALDCRDALFVSASTYIFPLFVLAAIFRPRLLPLFIHVSCALGVVGSVVVTRMFVADKCDAAPTLSSVVLHWVPLAYSLRAFPKSPPEHTARRALWMSIGFELCIVVMYASFNTWAYPITPLEVIFFGVVSTTVGLGLLQDWVNTSLT